MFAGMEIQSTLNNHSELQRDSLEKGKKNSLILSERISLQAITVLKVNYEKNPKQTRRTEK